MADRRGALLIGSHISRYVVLEALGGGGMGSVYLAIHAGPTAPRDVTPPRSAARAAAETGALAMYVVSFAQVRVDDSAFSVDRASDHHHREGNRDR
jgi:hypothetical protein